MKAVLGRKEGRNEVEAGKEGRKKHEQRNKQKAVLTL